MERNPRQTLLPFFQSGPPMRVTVLGSGSGGNAVLVACGERRLLIDAGFSCRQLEKRLATVDESAGDLDAVLITHEHSDHVRGCARLATRYDLPIYATGGTLRALARRAGGEAFARANVVRSGEPFEIAAELRIEAFRIPHDAAEPVGFVVESSGGCRLGLISDVGSRSQLAWGRLRDLDCLILETNHDLGMLRSGPYPWRIKQRIASRHGHLANHEAAMGLDDLISDRLRAVVLYHLSRTNNLPALALQAVSEALDRAGTRAEVVVSEQDQPTPWLEVTR